MTLHIEDYQLEVIIGTLESEQKNPQPIVVDLCIDYHYTPAKEQKAPEYLDYMDVLEVVQNKFSTAHYGLLEEALLEITSWLKQCFPVIYKIDMGIKKPQACQKALVGVSLSVVFENP
ncbi:dihydroneopterin aldolase [Helicobacter suis]|uniref:dihydroneopterin aldolase n=1 Tax=Helicobacter suis TaxID=104628 RepID=UPI0013D66B28|nr:dihydroneopterin aldolase [Helicobacter suis]